MGLAILYLKSSLCHPGGPKEHLGRSGLAQLLTVQNRTFFYGVPQFLGFSVPNRDFDTKNANTAPQFQNLPQVFRYLACSKDIGSILGLAAPLIPPALHLFYRDP